MVQEAVSALLGSSISDDAPLMDAGLDSLGAVELRNALEGQLKVQLPSTLVFDYPSINAVSEFIREQVGCIVVMCEGFLGMQRPGNLSLLNLLGRKPVP